MPRRLNVLYLHSHDTGRHVAPYGHQVPTPNIQRLAEEGVLFRQAFSVAPVCSGSRAALLTGEYAHTNGMLGLAHRGYRLNDYGHHIVHTLRAAGYTSALIGEQHVALDPDEIGYDEVVAIASTHAADVAPAAVSWLASAPEPYFLSVGFFETHREYPASGDPYALAPREPPGHARDAPRHGGVQGERRRAGRGRRRGGMEAVGPDTLVILTTDHGLAFPGAKATLTDRGLGVLLILRGRRASAAAACPTRWSRRSTSSRPSATSPGSSGRRGCEDVRCWKPVKTKRYLLK